MDAFLQQPPTCLYDSQLSQSEAGLHPGLNDLEKRMKWIDRISPASWKECNLGFNAEAVFCFQEAGFLALHWIDTVLAGHTTTARWVYHFHSYFYSTCIHYANCLALCEILFLSIYNLWTVQSTCARLELNGVVSVSHAAAPPTHHKKSPAHFLHTRRDCPETPPSLNWATPEVSFTFTVKLHPGFIP